MAKTTLLKKIVMGEVNGIVRGSGGFKPKAHFGADENGNFAPILVMRVAGIARGMEIGQTNYGEFIKFKGNFAAINSKGEEFRSPFAILPEPAAGLTREMVENAEGNPVEFAFDIIAVPDASDRGYKFQCQPLMEKVQGDPLDAIVSHVLERHALPAPTAQALVADSATGSEPAKPAEGASDKPADEGKKKK